MFAWFWLTALTREICEAALNWTLFLFHSLKQNRHNGSEHLQVGYTCVMLTLWTTEFWCFFVHRFILGERNSSSALLGLVSVFIVTLPCHSDGHSSPGEHCGFCCRGIHLPAVTAAILPATAPSSLQSEAKCSCLLLHPNTFGQVYTARPQSGTSLPLPRALSLVHL